jgi:nitrite reductase/ring-hydroxylating ferredoxin subunit
MRKLLALALLVLAFTGCGKTGEVVPNVSVSIQVPISDPRLNALHNVGGAVLLNGGVAGIIIYRSATGYVAYDRCSAYEPAKRCAVTLDNPSLTVTDPCSGSKWSLEDGTPVKAPAIKSLKAYAVNATQFEIFVSN